MYKVKNKLICILASILACLCAILVFSNVVMPNAAYDAEIGHNRDSEVGDSGVYATDIIDWKYRKRLTSSGTVETYVPGWKNTFNEFNGVYFEIAGDTDEAELGARYDYRARIHGSTHADKLFSIQNDKTVKVKFNVYMYGATSVNLEQNSNGSLEDWTDNGRRRIDLIINGYKATTEDSTKLNALDVDFAHELMRIRLDYVVDASSSQPHSVARILPYVGIVGGSDADWTQVEYGNGWNSNLGTGEGYWGNNAYGINRDPWIKGAPQVSGTGGQGSTAYYFEFSTDKLLASIYSGNTTCLPLLDSTYGATTDKSSQAGAFKAIKDYITNNDIAYIAFDVCGDGGFTGNVGVEVVEINGFPLGTDGEADETTGAITKQPTKFTKGMQLTVTTPTYIVKGESIASYLAGRNVWSDTDGATYKVVYTQNGKSETFDYGSPLTASPSGSGQYEVTITAKHNTGSFGEDTKTVNLFVIDMKVLGASIRFTDGAFRIYAGIKEADYDALSSKGISLGMLAAPDDADPTETSGGVAIYTAPSSKPTVTVDGYLAFSAVVVQYSGTGYSGGIIANPEKAYKTPVYTKAFIKIGDKTYYSTVLERSFFGVVSDIINNAFDLTTTGTGMGSTTYTIDSFTNPITGQTYTNVQSKYTAQQLGKAVYYYNLGKNQ